MKRGHSGRITAHLFKAKWDWRNLLRNDHGFCETKPVGFVCAFPGSDRLAYARGSVWVVLRNRANWDTSWVCLSNIASFYFCFAEEKHCPPQDKDAVEQSGALGFIFGCC